MKKALIVSIFTIAIIFSFASRGFALYSSTTPWPMYRHDAAHTGASTSDAPDNSNTLWTHGYSSGGLSQRTTPLIVDGRVIFKIGQWVIALDETTGVELWSHQTNAGTLTDATHADGRVFLGQSDANGGVVCLNASTGTQIWKQDASPYFVKANPLVYQGVVYAAVTDNYTYAFGAANGGLKWSYKTDGPVNSAPAADGNLLFLGSTDSKLYALDISGSTPVSVWNFTANGPIQSTPTIDGGRVIFGSDSHTLYALNETTGELIWTFATTDTAIKFRNGVTIANDVVYATSEDSSKIYALNAGVAPGNYTDSGISIIRNWTADLQTGLREPVYANGKIIVTSGGDPARLFALDAAVSTTLWSRAVSWWPELGNPTVADGAVWFSAYWWDPGSFTVYCIGNPFPPSTTNYIVNAGGQSFDVIIETNSTVKNFDTTALETQGKISFTVQGIGTTGMCNITIPNDMLDGEYNVTVDGEQPLYLASPLNNGTHTSLYFTYNTTSTHAIEITGTTFVPEFQPITIATLFLAVSFAIALSRSKKTARLY